MDTASEIIRILPSLEKADPRERFEVKWLKNKYAQFMDANGLRSKLEADRLLFERMYGKPPVRGQDTLKIRYWRTGQHLPINFNECRSFGAALELCEEDLIFLLQGYYDSCDRIYINEPADPEDVYWTRRNALSALTDAYLRHIPRGRLEELNIAPDALWHNLRHLYYTDALRYVSERHAAAKVNLNRHINSMTYDSELDRNLKLLGVIPRKTMIRHLIILGAPDISAERLSAQLVQLGYLPLHKWHTMRHGEQLDRLLLLLLRHYEEACAGRPRRERLQWLQKSCQLLDTHFAQQGNARLRFMFFKSLGE